MKVLNIEKIINEIKQQGFDCIFYTNDNAMVFYFGEENLDDNCYEKLIKEGLLNFIGIQEEEIKFFLSMGKDEIENIKTLINIKKLKSELEILENKLK